MSRTTEHPLAGRRILIVEDEYLIAAELEEILTREGAKVLTAGSIDRGFQLLGGEQPEAVILDLSLRGKVSAPLAAALAERNVPFVIVTGYGESWMTFSEFRDAHVAEKPVDGRQVVQLLLDALAVPEASSAP